MDDTEIYASSNGDRWFLVDHGGARQVEHRANLASGGAISRMDVDSFLASGRNSPEQMALRAYFEKSAATTPDAPADPDTRAPISIIDEVERMGDEIEERTGPHSDPAY